MRHEIQLITNGLIERRHRVTMDIAPHAGDAVDILPAIQVHQEAVMGPLDDQGRLRGIDLHGREGMPDVVPIPLFQLFPRGMHNGDPPLKNRTDAVMFW